MDKEKMNNRESFTKGFHIIKLYKDCNNITQDALILAILESIKETDFNRWARIIDITLNGNEADI